MNAKDADIASQTPAFFWRQLEQAHGSPEGFRRLLAEMTEQELVEFCWTYEELAAHLRTDTYSRHTDPSLSEDGLAELANWVVAQGEQCYRATLQNPERMPRKKNDPGLLSEIVEELDERFGVDIPFNTHTWDPDWRANGRPGPWV